MPAQLKYETVPLTAIKPHKRNPRDNTAAVDVVAASLREFGFLVPIVLDGGGEIIAGHTRYQAAKDIYKKKGEIRLPDGSLLPKGHVLVLRAKHLNPVQVRAFRVIDNRTSELATWKDSLLQQELAFLQDEGLALTPLGFDEDDIARVSKLAQQADALPPSTVDDEIEASEGDTRTRTVSRVPKSVRVQVGDIRFHVLTDKFEAWLHNLRRANKFDDARVIAALAKKMGLEYDGAEGESTPVQKGKAKPPAKRKR